MSESPNNDQARVNDWLAREDSRRADQLAINCRWLIGKMDEAHRHLCKGQNGTWQVRMQQVVDAAKRLAK
jgi:hypothetical protein